MQEELQLLKEATFEIKNLRRENELMRARLDMFDAMNAILHTQVAIRSQGMSLDLVWQIEKFVASKEAEQPKQ